VETISLAEAQRRIVERAKPVEGERVPVERAAGRVLAEPAVAAVDLPPFPSSAMDGYAVRAGDVRPGAALVVVGTAAAGAPYGRPLGPGEAVAIATGGVVPDGADAVVPVERTREVGGNVEVDGPAAIGAHVRPRASDIGRGAVVLPAGAVVGPVQVGALAAAGINEVQCRKRPRVGLLVTGSELRAPGQELGPGQIYESNGLMLAAQLADAGAVPAQLGISPDEEEELERTMERALLGFDMLVTSGGASVGPRDLVRTVQAGLRVEEVFWGVAIRPGRPVAFGARRSHLVFNLPGNPVSSLVCFELLVRPAIRALLGVPDPLPRFLPGLLASAVRSQAERDDFVRARMSPGDAGVSLEPLIGQESHMIAVAAGADALVRVPAGAGELPAGAAVRYLPL
jgi:molybdopterin molybdotransferase